MNQIRLQKTFSTEDYDAVNQLVGTALAQSEFAENLVKTYSDEYAKQFGISQEAWEVIRKHNAQSLKDLIQFIANEQTITFELPKEDRK